MALTSIAAATTILTNATKLLDSLREQAKSSKDTTLKEGISKLYDYLLDLKAAHIRVEEENAELRRQLSQPSPSPTIRQVASANYYYVGEAGPYCQPCFDSKEKLILLSPPQASSGGIYRKCYVCGKFFWEKPVDDGPAFGIVPNGW